MTKETYERDQRDTKENIYNKNWKLSYFIEDFLSEFISTFGRHQLHKLHKFNESEKYHELLHINSYWRRSIGTLVLI